PSSSASLAGSCSLRRTSRVGRARGLTSYSTASTLRRPPQTHAMLAPAEALAHLRLATDVAGLDVDELVVPAEHDVVVDGVRLHYLDWGRHGRPALLLLHGGCLTAHTWDLVCLALRAEFHCLALDQR